MKKKAKKKLQDYHKYELYEAAVQDPESEVQIIDQIYQENFDEQATVFREDFCSTFLNTCQWVREADDHRGIAIDLDPSPLEYGKKHHLSALTVDQQRRVHIHQANVLDVKTEKSDIISISNFSIGFLRSRAQLLQYFFKCYKDLQDEGMVVFDLLGGYEMSQEQEEERRVTLEDGYQLTYLWEHATFNPIDRDALFYIHFKKGKQERRKVFHYHWRMWTIPEISDVLRDAGFDDVVVYWENDDEDGEGDGTFAKQSKVEDCAIWIVYVAGLKKKKP
ncbi:MAG: hypothetical protein R3A11_01700 [Bdellovibrionota bacterium]